MQATTHTGSHSGTHETHHHEPGFLQKYFFSTDHKVIGIQYGLTALSFLLFGFLLMLCMRWQIAHPGQTIPLVGHLLEGVLRNTDGTTMMADGKMSPDVYNVFGAIHGTVMVFLAIVPLAFGAPDMAFPRVNMASYQFYLLGGITIFSSLFIPGSAAQAGWTSYSPLASTIPTYGQAFLLVGLVLLITSSLFGAVNFIATII